MPPPPTQPLHTHTHCWKTPAYMFFRHLCLDVRQFTFVLSANMNDKHPPSWPKDVAWCLHCSPVTCNLKTTTFTGSPSKCSVQSSTYRHTKFLRRPSRLEASLSLVHHTRFMLSGIKTLRVLKSIVWRWDYSPGIFAAAVPLIITSIYCT